jgi:hypothetical protein
MAAPIVQLEGLVEYTDAQLEQLAHDYLRSRVDVQLKLPINVEALLQGCRYVGLIDTVPGIAEKVAVEGCLCRHRNGSDLIIYIDEDIANYATKAKYNAVVAEELAHAVLHPAVFMQVKSFSAFLEVQNSPEWHRMERDAKRFSAAVRMPFRTLVVSAESIYPEIVQEHGFGQIWKIEKLLRNALAERFVVPQEDMQRRLLEWPCLVLERAAMSVQASSPKLLPSDAAIEVKQPQKQLRIF